MKITERNYLKQLKRGNEAALIYVMEQYGSLVQFVVRRHLYSLSQYEDDCVNEVFYAVWTHISNYKEEKNSFANWIAGIARLKALDYVRKYAIAQVELNYNEEEIEKIPDVSSTELTQHLSEEMEHLLSCLKKQDKELFYRLYVEEETMDEIQEQMQVEKSVLYNRLSRAKKKIRKQYGGNVL
ncbi:MAG: sigma-70 family RNA polymerase sigma factor [Eubacteriales bacterium]|nr:sigma-70 family RNA polymerase sigma factor [Eubacteriales bacterium]